MYTSFRITLSIPKFLTIQIATYINRVSYIAKEQTMYVKELHMKLAISKKHVISLLY